MQNNQYELLVKIRPFWYGNKVENIEYFDGNKITVKIRPFWYGNEEFNYNENQNIQYG